MSVNINFNGRLGADCEVRKNQNGKPYVVFRVATDEFRGGKTETAWLNVIDYTEKTQKMSPYLKKGSLVNVHGIETVGTYSTKSGEVGISRDVIADRVDFVSGGTAFVKTESPTDDMSCGTLKPKQDTRKIEPNPTTSYDDGDDDLPF